jgi:hypothetical protein
MSKLFIVFVIFIIVFIQCCESTKGRKGNPQRASFGSDGMLMIFKNFFIIKKLI